MEYCYIKDEIKGWLSKTIFIENKVDFNNNGVFKKGVEEFIADYKRYYSDDNLELEKIRVCGPLIAMLTYRLARNFYLVNDETSALVISNLGRFLSGIEIYYSASIGCGLRINHGVGTVIGARVKIGGNCLIHQNVTIGDRKNKRPIIGDNVTIYTGACVIGDIKIGNNAIVAANAVVLSDVPNNKKAIGVPAKIKG